MVPSSFDEIEAFTLASGQTAKFNDDQLTNEIIEVSGTPDGVETLEVYVAAGHQFNSGLSNAAANMNYVYYYGTTGAESIAGGAMNETIKGGAGNDLLSGGGGTDTYVFELAGENGIDRLSFGVVNGQAVDDKLDLSINLFLGDGTPDIGVITETNTDTLLTSNQANDNILILKNATYADAEALNLSNMQFAASFNEAGKVVFVYASSSITDARVAVATISNDGYISGAIDVAVLVGVTISEAATGLSASNFIL
jgi:Ca2+-binding RTX toxin-like protein